VRTWNPQWEATQPLDSAPKGLNRRVGVVVGRPFHHHGLNATYVDISRETPVVNTNTYGNSYPVTDVEQEARSAIEDTIVDLDRLISHLTEHRARLAADLVSLPNRTFITELPADA
jgi:hypothetical protein